MADMVDTLNTPWLALKEQPSSTKSQEYLGVGNPFAHSVAAPLFSARVLLAGIRCEKQYHTPLHTKEFHEVRVLLQGSFQIQQGEKVSQMKPGDLSFTRAGSSIKVDHTTDQACWWMSFTLEDSPNWEELKKQGDFVVSFEHSSMMFSLLRQMLDSYKSRNVRSMSASLDESEMLLRLLRRLIDRHGDEKQRLNVLRDLVSEIGNSPELDWDQTQMAKKVFVSPRTLSRLFRNEYGCSPLMMVTQQRLNRAMGLLVNTDQSMAEVANQSGYENVTSFSRTFSKHIGTTPGRFRRNTLVERRVEK